MGDGWSREQYPNDWDSRRKAVYARDGHTCQNCGAKGGPFGNNELHCHHIVPKSKGGSHAKSNLTTLCRDCHNKVHDHHIPKMSEVSSGGSSGPTSNRTVNTRASANLQRIGRNVGSSNSTSEAGIDINSSQQQTSTSEGTQTRTTSNSTSSLTTTSTTDYDHKDRHGNKYVYNEPDASAFGFWGHQETIDKWGPNFWIPFGILIIFSLYADSAMIFTIGILYACLFFGIRYKIKNQYYEKIDNEDKSLKTKSKAKSESDEVADVEISWLDGIIALTPWTVPWIFVVAFPPSTIERGFLMVFLPWLGGLYAIEKIYGDIYP